MCIFPRQEAPIDTVKQWIMDYPLLALLVVFPIMAVAGLIKVGIVLATGADPPPDDDHTG